ncbi:hypothetical protein OCU04_009903 [Sclerotinia nivalis]|uniref:Uncharacterized protein n=1 Tax=Sclerotinia nivalis TaxID=352851 RepID=A0A9X0AED6_9HELO|nr:hypothetical protein OCU04_009903 [Sclerotinia nivalis]
MVSPQNDIIPCISQKNRGPKTLKKIRGRKDISDDPLSRGIKKAADKPGPREAAMEKHRMNRMVAKQRREDDAARRQAHAHILAQSVYKKRVPQFCFPTELICKILRCLLPASKLFRSDYCTAVCFALTCRLHWKIFRQIYAGIIRLSTLSVGFKARSKDGWSSLTLGNLLKDWMYPKYRPMYCYVSTNGVMRFDPDRILLYISTKSYPSKGGEKEQKFASRIRGYRRNYFLDLQRTQPYQDHYFSHKPLELDLFVPNPYRMGDEWYFTTLRILKHTILCWPSDCADDGGEEWLNTTEYARNYGMWQTYKKWMCLRDWVEEQPAALEYKKLHVLSEDKTKTSMRHAFQMLRLVDMRSNQHKHKVKMVVEAMLKLVGGQADEVDVIVEYIQTDIEG